MSTQSLQGLRVLDLSRVLAGPFCTQMLGDLGADIIKVERPGVGDDTRKWGPPFLEDAKGVPTSESAYYLSCNRNKQSIAVDITKPEGQAIIHQLIAKSDVLIENFKVGGLKKYGLGYEQLKEKHPGLVYCSISGFGQNGPLASEPGYDFLAQGMTGLMACTGAADAEPMKVGVALSDIMTGMNAAIGILAALRHKEQTGEGQMVDVALTDCTLASLTNIAQYYLTSGKTAPRLGNAHSAIVPYQAFEAEDGYLILAVGNDSQFGRFCAFLEKEWAQDPRFETNSARVENRDALVPMIQDALKDHSVSYWIESFEAINVPCGPVNRMDQVFEMEQIYARDMQIEMAHPYAQDPIALVGSPIKMSKTPVHYKNAPPICGQDTESVLKDLLDQSDDEIATLIETGIIER
ncbi:MAG: CaiB/BaiF CoA transferase family protein [Bdellovibrionales bacterium]